MCGIGVTSAISVICRPAAANDLIAVSLPRPIPLHLTATVFKPSPIAAFAQLSAAIPAAYGVDFLLPL